MRTFKASIRKFQIYSLVLSIIVTRAIYYNPMNYLFYNWNFVPFDPLHPFCLTPISPPLATIPIHSSVGQINTHSVFIHRQKYDSLWPHSSGLKSETDQCAQHQIQPPDFPLELLSCSKLSSPVSPHSKCAHGYGAQHAPLPSAHGAVPLRSKMPVNACAPPLPAWLLYRSVSLNTLGRMREERRQFREIQRAGLIHPVEWQQPCPSAF